MIDLIAGNSALKNAVKQSLSANHLSHCILLCGELGTGTGYAARCIAADYLYPSDPNGAKQVMTNQSSECVTLEGTSKTGLFEVDKVRSLRTELYNTALSANGRVFILKDVQNLNAESGNALLKVLEEPPEGVLFILTAQSAAVVMQTIRSRCSIYTLSSLSVDECEKWLKTNCNANGKVKMLASVCGGRIGIAKRIIDDALYAKQFNDALDLSQKIVQKNEYAANIIMVEYEKKRSEAKQMLKLFSLVCSASLRNEYTAEYPMDSQTAAKCIEAAYEAIQLLNKNITEKSVFTNMIFNMINI